jgi:tetratricopeptide (TPR) repeat protein
MLAPVREYALERLAADPDRRVAYRRLAGWCLRLVGEHAPALERAERPAALELLDAELPNALAAMQHAIDEGDAQTALELVTAWAPYWRAAHGGRQSGARWVDAALAAPGQADELTRTRARLERLDLHGMRREDRDAHRAELLDVLACFEAVQDDRGLARTLSQLAWFHTWGGEFERAEAFVDAAIEAAERSGDPELVATVMAHTSGTLGSYDAMAPRARLALEHLDRVGYVTLAAHASGMPGYLAIVEGRFEEALPWLDRALAVVDRTGDLYSRYVVTENQALARVLLGDLEGAARFYDAALRVARTAGAGDIIDEALLGTALLRARLGDPGGAARLAGAAARHETRGRAKDEQLVWERLLAGLAGARAADPDRWARLEADGARLSRDEAVDLALNLLADGAADTG